VERVNFQGPPETGGLQSKSWGEKRGGGDPAARENILPKMKRVPRGEHRYSGRRGVTKGKTGEALQTGGRCEERRKTVRETSKKAEFWSAIGGEGKSLQPTAGFGPWNREFCQLPGSKEKKGRCVKSRGNVQDPHEPLGVNCQTLSNQHKE